MSSRLTKLITGIGMALVALIFVSTAHAQTTPVTVWNPNYASGTITPRPNTLQIPCANIVGGCSSGASSTAGVSSLTGTAGQVSVSAATGSVTLSLPQNIGTNATPTFAGATVNGNVSSTSFTANTTGTVSHIANLDTVMHAANATPAGFTDYGQYLNLLCPPNASNTLVVVPQMSSVSVSTTISNTNGCLYQGPGGKAAHLVWTGSQGGVVFQINSNANSHVSGGGVQGIWFDGGNPTTTNPTVCVLQGGSTGAVNTMVQYNVFTNCGTAIQTASTTYFINDSNNLFANDGQTIISRSNLYPSAASGEGLIMQNEVVLDSPFNSPGGCMFISGAESFDLTGLKNDDCQLVLGSSGGSVTGLIGGGDSENAAAATNPNYPAYTPIVIASNTFNNVTINGFDFTNDASSTTSTPAQYIQITGGTLTVNGASAYANNSGNASSVLSFVNASGMTKVNLQGISGAVGSVNGNGYVNLVNSINTDVGSIAYQTGGAVGTTGFAAYNGTAGSSSLIRVDANAGSAGLILGNNGATEWFVCNNGANSNIMEVATSVANCANTSGNPLQISRTTGLTSLIGLGIQTSTLPSASCGIVTGSSYAGTVVVTTSTQGCTLTFGQTFNNLPSVVFTSASSTSVIIRSDVITKSSAFFSDSTPFPTSSAIDYFVVALPN